MILYVHPDGLLGMAALAPCGTLPLIAADEAALADAIAVLADDAGEDGWRVPGLDRTTDGLARLNAVHHFVGRVRFRMAGVGP